MSDVCPSCSAPMVGTNPTTRPAARARSSRSRQAATDSTTSTVDCPYTAAGCAGTVTAGCAGTVAAGGAGTGASAWASRVARAAPAW